MANAFLQQTEYKTRNNTQQFLLQSVAEEICKHMNFEWALETVNGKQ